MGITGAIVIVADAHKGSMPRPRNILGLGFAFMGLAALADTAPEIVIPFAWLVVTATLLDRGPDALAGIGIATGRDSPSPVAAATPAATVAPTGTAPANPVGANLTVLNATRLPSPGAAIGSLLKPLQTAYTNLGGVAAHTGGGRGGVDNWESSNAVDMGAPLGTPIYAVDDGTISAGNFGFNTLGGNRLHLVTSNNEYYYAHLSRFAVQPGQRVTKGQVLGYVGNTGDASGGPPHLHIASKIGNPETLFGFK